MEWIIRNIFTRLYSYILIFLYSYILLYVYKIYEFKKIYQITLFLCIHELCDPSNPSHLTTLCRPSCAILSPRDTRPDE